MSADQVERVLTKISEIQERLADDGKGVETGHVTLLLLKASMALRACHRLHSEGYLCMVYPVDVERDALRLMVTELEECLLEGDALLGAANVARLMVPTFAIAHLAVELKATAGIKSAYDP